MAVQDQSESDTTHPRMISLDVGAPSLRNILPEDKICLAEDYAPKIRKQYTITKQRERWSDEEHGKFLEALKLHGRGWRRIEEHVGTKTAVQIRSHAQKFFTKVVRDSNNGDANSVKSVEIPPPRPKRKPMHPYPRKLAIPVKSIPLVPEESKRSVSPESRSPTSVLSVLGSDAFGAVDSCKPSDRSSPDSSAVVENPDDLVVSEPSDRILEEKRSPPPQDYASSNPDNQACVKLELFPEENDFVKEEGSVEASSTLSLKLFGQTVLVADCNIPSNQTSGRTLLTDVKDQPASRTFSPSESECGPSTLTIGSPTSSPFLPRGMPYVSAAFPCAQVHNPIPMKGRPLFHYKDSEDDETQKEGSSTGSNGESASGELTGDKTSEVEAESSQELSSVRASVPSFSKRRNNSNSSNRMQGFVPYKRCLAERGISSTLTGEEREEQRTRLCL